MKSQTSAVHLIPSGDLAAWGKYTVTGLVNRTTPQVGSEITQEEAEALLPTCRLVIQTAKNKQRR